MYSGKAGFRAISLREANSNGSIPYRQELKGYSNDWLKYVCLLNKGQKTQYSNKGPISP